MERDQFGRPVAVGDTVALNGKVVELLDNPNYINCTVLLDQPMPPSGAETKVQCNTQQLVNTSPGEAQEAKQAAQHQQAAQRPANQGSQQAAGRHRRDE